MQQEQITAYQMTETEIRIRRDQRVSLGLRITQTIGRQGLVDIDQHDFRIEARRNTWFAAIGQGRRSQNASGDEYP
ncbi:hypothetical protein D3C80_1960820 [compost metagenome]